MAVQALFRRAFDVFAILPERRQMDGPDRKPTKVIDRHS